MRLLAVVNKAQFNPVNTRCETHHTPTNITQSIKLGHHIPSPHHASGSSSSFTETYPHFSALQYDVMNLDGMYSSIPLTRPEHVPNIPWPDPVCF